MNFVIADTHFYHKNIIEYENRPFATVEEMNKTMIDNWNSVVKPEDTVYHLGDVAFCDREKAKGIMGQLNGYKILVMGNHDRRKSVTYWLDVGFNEVYKTSIAIRNMALSHEPIMNTELFNICGHMHSRTGELTDKHYCVSVENIGYTPLSIYMRK